MSTGDQSKKGRKGHQGSGSDADGAAAESTTRGAANTRRKVTELSHHIDVLGKEVDHLKKAARREVEGHWAVHHTELFPRFLRWREALGIEMFSVFSLEGALLRPEALLSSPQAPRLETPLHVRQDASQLATWWGGTVGDLLAFALASRDCQVDFRTGVLCVPIVFFDDPRGIILARVKGLSSKSYGAVMAETAVLLSHVRDCAQAGQAGLPKALSSAS